MQYNINELITEIKIALDLNKSTISLLEERDIETLSLEEIIESKIAPAARIVENSAPLHLLGPGKSFDNSIGWDTVPGIGSGHIHLPDDFLRLVSFQMSDWKMPVSVAITEDNPLYAMQKSNFPGIRGSVQKPIVAITTQPIGQVLEFYSCSGGDNVYIKKARYIPIPKIEGSANDRFIDISEKLVSAVIFYSAYMVAMTIGEKELAETLLIQSNELIK